MDDASTGTACQVGAGIGSFSVGPCTFHAPGTGIVFTAPTGRVDAESGESAGLHMILAGTDLAGVRKLVEYSFASNQALTRAPLSNMVPDFLVAGPRFRERGYGGALALGHWDHRWRWAQDVSSMRCSYARRD